MEKKPWRKKPLENCNSSEEQQGDNMIPTKKLRVDTNSEHKFANQLKVEEESPNSLHQSPIRQAVQVQAFPRASTSQDYTRENKGASTTTSQDYTREDKGASTSTSQDYTREDKGVKSMEFNSPLCTDVHNSLEELKEKLGINCDQVESGKPDLLPNDSSNFEWEQDSDYLVDDTDAATEDEQIHPRLEKTIEHEENSENEINHSELYSPLPSQLLEVESKSDPLNCNMREQCDQSTEQGTVVNKKTNFTRKDFQSIKEVVEPGNEYQRVIQVLLRSRGLKVADFKLGTELTKTGDLDDIVYCTGKKSCRFIQVKYHNMVKPGNASLLTPPKAPQTMPTTVLTPPKAPQTTPTTVLRELFNTKNYNKKAGFQILRYFRSFCKIKENEMYRNLEIIEITIVTNRPLIPERNVKLYQSFAVKEDKFKEFLVLRDDFESDDLYLGKVNGNKYSLNVNALNNFNEFMKCLVNIYNQFQENQGKDPQKATEVIREFLEKVCVVVDYPNLEKIKSIVFQEVCDDHGINDMHADLLIHFELNHVAEREKDNDEHKFLSNDEWKVAIEKVRQDAESLKVNGIVKHKTDNLLNRYSSITFQLDRIKDICEDIVRFLTHDEIDLFHYNNVENEKLAAIKTVAIINNAKEINKHELLRENTVLSTKLGCLIQNRSFIGYFLNGLINTLVITTGNYQHDDKSKDLANELMNGLENTKQKVIIISSSNNPFTETMRTSSRIRCSEKSYDHDFSCLSQKAKEDILAKQVLFQGKTITFGSLFNNDLSFSNNIIDDNVLMKITDNKEEPLILLDTAAFTSPGYNEKYYISRELFQKQIHFDVVKERMKEELFFITPTNGMDQKELKDLLLANNIGSNYIKELPKRKVNRKIEKSGIVLRGLANESNDKIFKEITDRNILANWLFVHKSTLFYVDSNFVSREGNKPIENTQPTYMNEVVLALSLPLAKILILAGDSGVGKSTVLTHIANNISNQSSDKPVWIVKVNLKNFYRQKMIKQIGDLSKIDLTVSLTSEMGSFNDSTDFIAKRIIQEGLKKTQEKNFSLVLLLDGFNEIGLSYQEKTCSLINTLRSECNVKQIWITTQIQGKVKLENKLEVPAYFLRNLDDEKQVSLMTKYWTTKYDSSDPPTNYDTDELQEDAKKALQSWKKSIDDQSFTQVSLHVIILSSILVPNRKIKVSMDLYNLYEMFIHNKFSVYSKECSEYQQQFLEAERIKEKLFEHAIKEILQELSVHFILTTYSTGKKQDISETRKLLNSMDALQKFKDILKDLEKDDIEVNCETILSKIGFSSVKESVDFIHESFAQYFFSEYLVKNLNNKIIKNFFVKYVLSENHLHLCRKFLNSIIKKHWEGKKEMKYNLFKSVSQLSKSDTSRYIKTWAVTKVIMEEKLDYVIVLLLNLIWTKRRDFFEQWVRKEIHFYGEDEESVKQIVNHVSKKEREKVSYVLRMIVKIDKKPEDDKETKLQNILAEQQCLLEDEKSQDV